MLSEVIENQFTRLTILSGVHFLSMSQLIRTNGIVTGANNSVCDIETAPIIQCESIGEPIRIVSSQIVIECLNFYNCHINTVQSRNLLMRNINFYESFYESNMDINVNIDSALFYNTGVSIERSRPQNPLLITIAILGSRFLLNQPLIELPGVEPDPNSQQRFFSDGVRALHLYETAVVIVDCDFRNSQYSAINAQLSTIGFSGNSSFIDNTGYRGGAISLEASSMRLFPLANLVFENNHARDLGGAIYSTEEVISQHLINLISPIPNQDISNNCALQSFQGNLFHIRFKNNSALNGGSAIHGVTLQGRVCSSILIGVGQIEERNFFFEPDDSSTVTANPQRVCICDDDGFPDCSVYGSENDSLSPLNFEIFPGQQISVNVIAVGFTFGTVSSPVYAQLLSPGPKTQLSSSLEQSQIILHSRCSQLLFTVLSNRSNETLILSPLLEPPAMITSPDSNVPYNETNAFFRLTRTVSDGNLIVTPVNISIKYLPCPLGFELTEDRPQCECEPLLNEHGLECNIETQTVTRSGNTWINASHFTNNKSIVHNHCPFGFCNSSTIAVNLLQPDSQCSFNRSGTLCGACKPGLSIVLGTSECLECSNRYIALLIVFIVAGIVLVTFIKFLNLTVTQGTIGGLIFYANIVGSNQSIFFPQEATAFTKILNTFIAWINLDWGINTCFFDGLDAYEKTWLQFVFPLYIWSITVFMIVTAHYSTHATKLFGNNSVPVLATLLLLSYAKLLRTIIIILSFTILELPDGSEQVVWSFDGNINYFDSKHAILFIAALLMIFLLGLPYTAFLVLGHWPKRLSKHKGFTWMLNLNHFFDAYYAPFKNKHVHWVGILLLIRILLFVFFAAFFAVQNNVNLLLIAFTAAILLLYSPALGHAYREKKLTLLEGSFFLNLIILSGGTFYVRLTNGNQEVLICISTAIAFIEFAAIVVYHSYHFVALPKYERHKRIEHIKKRKSIDDLAENPNVDDPPLHQNKQVPSTTIISIDGNKLVSCTVIAKPDNDIPLTQQVHDGDIPSDQRNGKDMVSSFELSEVVETTQVQISVPGYITKSE